MVGKTGFASDVTRRGFCETPGPSADSRGFLRGRWGAGRHLEIAAEGRCFEAERGSEGAITAAGLSCARRRVKVCGQVSERRERLWAPDGTVIGTWEGHRVNSI